MSRRRRQGTGWQITVAIAGITIVALALLAGRVREATLVSTPSAVVGSNQAQTTGQASTQSGQAATDPQSAQGSDPAAGADAGAGAQGSAAGTSASAGSSAGAKAGSHSASGSARGHAGASTSGVPAVPAVTGTAQTLFNDTFSGDPLGTALPSGWSLASVTSGGGSQSSGGLLSGLPLVGSLPLLGGGDTSSVNSLLPQLVTDGTQTVLSRVSNSWSLLTAGSGAWLDYSVSANMKTLPPGVGFVGISGRVKDNNNYLACGMRDDNALQLWQIVNGQAKLLDSKALDVPSGVFDTVTMTMQGGQVSCALNGQTLLHGTDSSIGAGKIGLIDLGSVSSEVSQVTATALP